MNGTRKTRTALVAVLCALVLLSGCGGGSDSAASSAQEPIAATPSALTLPVPPAAAGDTVVQARYQPQVRELLSQPGGPQLELRDADGTLHFSAPPGALAGQVLIVAGQAYGVTAVDATGRVLSTRAPELGEVFASLRVKALVQDGTLAAPAAAGSDARRRALAAATPSAALEFTSGPVNVGPVAISYKGQLGLTLALDLDFSADAGFKTLRLTGDGLLSHALLLTLNKADNAAAGASGIELGRATFVIPQSLGLVKFQVPLMLQAQFSGEAKMTGPLAVGATRLRFDLHWDTSTRQLVSDSGFDNSATAGPLAALAPASLATESLGLNVKIGPDVTLTVLESVKPLSVSIRANAGLKLSHISAAQRSCFGWAAQITGEGTAKAKVAGLELQKQWISPALMLGEGGDLALCDALPTPTPTPSPAPAPTTPPVDGLALLPLPVGATLLNGYELVLAADTWTPDPRASFNLDAMCFDSALNGIGPQAGTVLETPRYCGHTLEPQVRLPDGSRVDISTAAYQNDWITRFDALGEARCALALDDSLLGLQSPPDPRLYTQRQGELSTMPLLSRTPPNNGPAGLVYALAPAALNTNRVTLVCQMLLTERSSGRQVYLRSAVWTSPAGRMQVYSGVLWTSLGY